MLEPLRPPHLVRHMAAPNGRFPPNSLEAIRVCLEEGADAIEIDATALADGDFLVVHDQDLASQTTGSGPLRECPLSVARDLCIKPRDGAPTTYRVPLLSDVVALLLEHPGKTRLQVDLKDVDPFASPEPIERLARILEPLDDRVIVSSEADWRLHALANHAPWLDLGFDPGFYLAWYPPEYVNPDEPPYRIGAYGYLDSHPIAARRTLLSSRYLATRCDILLAQAPRISTMYIYHGMLARSLDDGFSWAEALHAAGVRLDAWTLDTRRPRTVEHAVPLRDAGVDLFTTDTPAELAALLDGSR